MTSQEPEWQAIVGRLERMERENRWWRRLGLLGVAGAAAVMLMGQGASGRRDVEAQSFVLLDGTGRLQARLGMLAGGPALQLFDQDGQGRAALSIRPDSTPLLSLVDGTGRGGATLAVGANRDTALLLRDPEGKVRASLGLDPHGAELVFPDRQGVGRVAIDVPGEDGARLVMQDGAGMTRAALAIDKTGAPTLRVMDPTGRPRAVLTSTDLGPTFTLYDPNGAARTLVGPVELRDPRRATVVRRPASSVVLFDQDGKVLWQAP